MRWKSNCILLVVHILNIIFFALISTLLPTVFEIASLVSLDLPTPDVHEHGYILKQRLISKIAYWYLLIHGIPFLFNLLFPRALLCNIDVRPSLSLTEASEVALVRKSSLCYSSFNSVDIFLSTRLRQNPGIQDVQKTSTREFRKMYLDKDLHRDLWMDCHPLCSDFWKQLHV
jgi:hypothetical protein